MNISDMLLWYPINCFKFHQGDNYLPVFNGWSRDMTSYQPWMFWWLSVYNWWNIIAPTTNAINFNGNGLNVNRDSLNNWVNVDLKIYGWFDCSTWILNICDARFDLSCLLWGWNSIYRDGQAGNFETQVYNIIWWDTLYKPVDVICYNPDPTYGWRVEPRSSWVYNSNAIWLISFVGSKLWMNSTYVSFTGHWAWQSLTQAFPKLNYIWIANHSASGASPFIITWAPGYNFFTVLMDWSEMHQWTGATVPLVTYIPDPLGYLVLPALNFSRFTSDNNTHPLILINNLANPWRVIPYLLWGSKVANGSPGKVIADVGLPSSHITAEMDSDSDCDNQVGVFSNQKNLASEAMKTNYTDPYHTGNSDVDHMLTYLYWMNRGIDIFWDGSLGWFEYMYNLYNLDGADPLKPINLWLIKPGFGPLAYSWFPRSVWSYDSNVIKNINIKGIWTGNGQIIMLGDRAGQQMSRLPNSIEASGIFGSVTWSSAPFLIDKGARFPLMNAFSHLSQSPWSSAPLIQIIPSSLWEKRTIFMHYGAVLSGWPGLFPLVQIDNSGGLFINMTVNLKDLSSLNGTNIFGDSTAPILHSSLLVDYDLSSTFDIQTNIIWDYVPTEIQKISNSSSLSITPKSYDNGTLMVLDGASPISVILPKDSTALFPVGSRIDFLQDGVGVVTFIEEFWATLHSKWDNFTINGQYVIVSAVKIASNTRRLAGDLTT